MKRIVIERGKDSGWETAVGDKYEDLLDVIWLKSNPIPNWLKVRFTNATETPIWATKDKKPKKYTFNKEYAKEFGIGKTMGNIWQIPICSGKKD